MAAPPKRIAAAVPKPGLACGDALHRRIILLSGWSGSGKNSVAEIMNEEGMSPKPFLEMAFAEPLKREVALELGVPFEWTQTQEGKRRVVEGKTLRQHLIDRAAFVRETEPDTYVNWVIDQLADCDAENIVVTDWRYPNEVQRMKEEFEDVETWRVDRFPKFPEGLDPASERLLDDYPFDQIIGNRVSRDNLRKNVKRALMVF